MVLVGVMPVPAAAGGSGRSPVVELPSTAPATQVPPVGAFAFGKTHSGGILPIRWDPCGEPIRVRLAGAAWDDSHGRALRYALRQMKSATGLPLRLDRVEPVSFDAVKWYSQLAVDRRQAEPQELRGIVVSVGAAPRHYPGALGSGVWFSRGEGADEQLVAGLVQIDAAASNRLPRQVRAAMYMHELGHVIGLSHVSDEHQIMYPTIAPPSSRTAAAAMPEWGGGDLRGLELLGRAAGCSPRSLAVVRAVRVEATRTVGKRGRILLRWRSDPTSDAFRVRISTTGRTGRWRFTRGNSQMFRGLLPGRHVLQVRAVASGRWGPVATIRTRL